MELIFLLGLAYAASRAIEHLKAPASAQWAKYRNARQGKSPADRAKARTARAAAAGFWVSEAAHLFPHARHGWAKGWAEHQAARDETARDHAKMAASHETRRARIRAETAAYRHRLEVARKRNSRPPTMTDQLDAERAGIPVPDAVRDDPAARWAPSLYPYPNGEHPMRGKNCTDPGCSCHAADPPLADGKTPGNGSPQHTGGTMAGDMNYDTAVETSDNLIAAADQAANDEALGVATTMADELGGMTPGDSGLLSLASDVVTAAATVRDGARELQDKSAALKDHLVKNYGPIQEAVDSGPGAAPEKEFVSH